MGCPSSSVITTPIGTFPVSKTISPDSSGIIFPANLLQIQKNGSNQAISSSADLTSFKWPGKITSIHHSSNGLTHLIVEINTKRLFYFKIVIRAEEYVRNFSIYQEIIVDIPISAITFI